MSNDLKHAFGDKNNSEFIISPEGKILVARDWSNPEKLRSELEEFVGKADTLTKVSDLDRNPERTAPDTKAKRGVVDREKRPSGAQPLVVRPVGSDEADAEPFYVKLRAEAPGSLLQNGKGQLYLGFHLDPIHHVHWNNLAAPLKYEITVPDGVDLSPARGEAAKVEKAEADLDPREFLVNVDFGGKPDEPLNIRVDYFACDDGDRFCKAVTQEYVIEWRIDRDGGRVQGGSGGRPSGGGNMTRRPGGGSVRGLPNAEMLLTRMDTDDDKKISRDEARGPMVQRFDQMDADDDGFVTVDEMRIAFERRRGGAGPGRGRPGSEDAPGRKESEKKRREP